MCCKAARIQADDTPPPPITVARSEPSQFTNGGQDGVLSIFGTNFTDQTTIRLVGIGLLNVTFVNSGALTAVLPADLPPGTYGIEVSDPLGGTAASPNTLAVSAPATDAATGNGCANRAAADRVPDAAAADGCPRSAIADRA